MSLADGVLTRPLFGDAAMHNLFGDKAMVSAMLEIEATLADVQADLGMLPRSAADEIGRVCRSTLPSVGAIAAGVAAAGVPIPALLAELRRHLSPKASDWLHFGATSQDIVDTAFCLQFARALSIIQHRLERVIDGLEALSHLHRDTLMLARTRGQMATPITFGLRAAQWAQPLIASETLLDGLLSQALPVQLGGAAGSRSALGRDGQTLAESMAERLRLSPSQPWHTDRKEVRDLAHILSEITAAIAKLGRDVGLMARGEVAEATLQNGGGSSTMPHKSNPVAAETLQSLHILALGHQASLTAAAVHSEERDGVNWSVEWAVMPALFETAAAACAKSITLIDNLVIRGDEMQARVASMPEVRAEAAVFALAPQLGRIEAAKRVSHAMEHGVPLVDVLSAAGHLDPAAALSDAEFVAAAARVARQIFAKRSKGARLG